MSVELRSAKQTIYFVGAANHQIMGAKLPSNRQILANLFLIFEKLIDCKWKRKSHYSQVHYFLGKARIRTKSSPNCVKKLVDLNYVWRSFKKIVWNPKIFIGWNLKIFMKSQDINSMKFQMDLDNLFDITHSDALKRMKIEEDKMFLHRQLLLLACWYHIYELVLKSVCLIKNTSY